LDYGEIHSPGSVQVFTVFVADPHNWRQNKVFSPLKLAEKGWIVTKKLHFNDYHQLPWSISCWHMVPTTAHEESQLRMNESILKVLYSYLSTTCYGININMPFFKVTIIIRCGPVAIVGMLCSVVTSVVFIIF